MIPGAWTISVGGAVVVVGATVDVVVVGTELVVVFPIVVVLVPVAALGWLPQEERTSAGKPPRTGGSPST